MQGTSRQSLYDKVGLISLSKVPSQDNYAFRSVSARKLNSLPSRSKSFTKAFFPYCIDEWNKLNPEVRNAKSIHTFKKSIKIEKLENSLYNVHDPLGVKLLSFRRGFNDRVNPMCPCGTQVETNEHFLLRCHCFSTQRSALFDNLYNIDPSFPKLNNKKKVCYLLYASASNPSTLNKVVINLVIKYFKSTGRFDKPLILDQ